MSRVKSPETTLKILGFLWQWKLGTTAALSFKFFRGIKFHSAYKRIKALEKRGLIQMISDSIGEKFFWILTKKGFKAVQEHLPALKQEGFKSEHMYHDYLVSCFHLGDWLAGFPNGAHCFSEQQLRRYEKNEYPSWVPKDERHRPDGYWNIGDKVIAVEVELKCKSENDYFTVGKFYDWNKSIHSVFWLVPSLAIAKRIQRYIESAHIENVEAHNFVILPDFKTNGWNAVFLIGALKGKTIGEALGRVKGVIDAVPPTSLLMDASKWLTKFADYKNAALDPKQPLYAISP